MRVRHDLLLFLGFIFLVFLAGCGMGTDGPSATLQSGSGNNFSSSVPTQFQKARAGLTAQVVVDPGAQDSRTVDLTYDPATDRFNGTIPNLPVGPHTFVINFFLHGVLVATSTTSATIEQNATAGIVFPSLTLPDDDNDGVSTLNEVEAFAPGSDAFRNPALTPTGKLDITFDADGITTTPIGSSASAQAVAVQADGKIVVAGTSSNAFAVARYDGTGGTLDPTFGTGGIAITPIGASSSATALGVVLQPTDGKIVVVGRAFEGQNKFAVVRYNTNGTLDTSFGTGGFVTTPIGTSATAQAVAIQNGKIVVGGNAFDGATKFALARYNANGTLDTSLTGGTGIILTSIGTSASITDIKIQSDNKIVAAGRTSEGQSKFAVARYLATNAALDITFDGDGIVTTLIGTSATGSALIIQPDGKIVVAGNIFDGASKFGVARYLSTGALDSAAGAFGTGGIVTTPVGTSANVSSITLQGDGKIVVGGNSFDSTSRFGLARYNTNGTLDTGFDGDGTAVTQIGGAGTSSNLTDVVFQNNGVIAVGSSGGRFTLARYGANGQLNTTFGTGGIVTTPMGSSASAQSVKVQSDGKIIAAGSTFDEIGKTALTRYNENGSLDPTFGTGGIVTTSIGSSANINDVAVQADGKIVTGGGAFDGTNFNFTLVRYHPNGTLDGSFGGDGIVITPIGISDFLHTIAVQPDGKILAGGSIFDGATNKAALVRYNVDGSLDTTFDTDGIVTTLVGTSFFTQAMAMQTDGKIVVAGGTFDGSASKLALVRYNADGSLDTTFDTDGIITPAFASLSDFISDLAIQPDGKIVLAGGAFDGTTSKIALFRHNADGSRDSSFDTDGVVNTAINNSASASSVIIQPDGKILIAGSTFDGTISRAALVRYHPDGSIDATFDGGIITPAIGTSAFIAELDFQPDGKIVGAGTSNGQFAIIRVWK